MAKRFNDTDLWKKQRWFRKLTPDYKLAFCYIKDQCDHAGIWNIDCADLIDDLGIKEFDINDFAKMCNIEYDKINGEATHRERIRILGKGYLWVTGFIQFQYRGKNGLVSIEAAPVKTALQRLSGLNLLSEGLDKGYISLAQDLPDGYLTPKEKDKGYNVLTVKNSENGQKSETGFSGIFKARGEEVLIKRHLENLATKERNRQKDSDGEDGGKVNL